MDESDEKLAYYLSIGAISVEGVDETGEIIYAISEIAKEIAPELWAEHQKYVDNSLLELFERGLISVEYNENLEAMIQLSPEGYEIARDAGLVEFNIDKDIPNN